MKFAVNNIDLVAFADQESLGDLLRYFPGIEHLEGTHDVREDRTFAGLFEKLVPSCRQSPS